MYLKKLNHQIDAARFTPYLDNVRWDSHGRCAINHPTGNILYDSYEINDEWRGTEFEKLINEIPVAVGEVRLMKLEAGNVYRSHADIDDRIHLNLQSNEQCYLIDLNNRTMYPVNKDNELYLMDGSYLHTAANFGSSARIQVVMRIPLLRYNDPDFVDTTIKFTDPPVNLRYIIDQHISPWLNRYVKNKMLGYFDNPNPLEYQLLIAPSALTSIVRILEDLKITYTMS